MAEGVEDRFGVATDLVDLVVGDLELFLRVEESVRGTVTSS